MSENAERRCRDCAREIDPKSKYVVVYGRGQYNHFYCQPRCMIRGESYRGKPLPREGDRPYGYAIIPPVNM